jgi:hypothetical protein
MNSDTFSAAASEKFWMLEKLMPIALEVTSSASM